MKSLGTDGIDHGGNVRSIAGCPLYSADIVVGWRIHTGTIEGPALLLYKVAW